LAADWKKKSAIHPSGVILFFFSEVFFLFVSIKFIHSDKMEAETPQGTTSSSADRMVGMEHSEVRYFTRYGFDNVDSCWFFFSCLLIII